MSLLHEHRLLQLLTVPCTPSPFNQCQVSRHAVVSKTELAPPPSLRKVFVLRLCCAVLLVNRELGFEGVPHRETVLVLPTVNCLVELTQMPFTGALFCLASYPMVWCSARTADMTLWLMQARHLACSVCCMAVHLDACN